jgi:hypothetical protein
VKLRKNSEVEENSEARRAISKRITTKWKNGLDRRTDEIEENEEIKERKPIRRNSKRLRGSK